MNIKDTKFRELNGIIFIAPDGNLIEGEFHAPYVSDFFGLGFRLTPEEQQKRRERFDLFDKCRDQMGYYNINIINFFVQYYGYDRTTPYAIISSKENAYETYFNWLLEGYEIHRLRPISLNEGQKFFYPEENTDIISKDLAIKKEALAIRNNTPRRELKRYYR